MDVVHQRPPVPASKCNQPCRGNASEVCGGPYSAHVFSIQCHTGTDPIPSPSPSPPSPVPPPGPPSPSPHPAPPTPPGPPGPRSRGQYQCQSQQPPVPGSFCDTTLSIEQRVNLVVANLTDSEKVSVVTTKGGVNRLGIANYPMWAVESLHGVRLWPEKCPFPDKCTTIYPPASASGRAFNKTLWRAIGTGMGTEGRTLFNLGIITDLSLRGLVLTTTCLTGIELTRGRVYIRDHGVSFVSKSGSKLPRTAPIRLTICAFPVANYPTLHHI